MYDSILLEMCFSSCCIFNYIRFLTLICHHQNAILIHLLLRTKCFLCSVHMQWVLSPCFVPIFRQTHVLINQRDRLKIYYLSCHQQPTPTWSDVMLPWIDMVVSTPVWYDYIHCWLVTFDSWMRDAPLDMAVAIFTQENYQYRGGLRSPEVIATSREHIEKT